MADDWRGIALPCSPWLTTQQYPHGDKPLQRAKMLCVWAIGHRSPLQNSAYLRDKLISATITYLEKRDNLKPGYIGVILGDNPYKDPKLENFRQECLDFRYNIQFFILSKIADLNTGKYTLPPDIPLMQPSPQEINNLLGKRVSLRGNTDKLRAELGEAWLYRLYDECEETLQRF